MCIARNRCIHRKIFYYLISYFKLYNAIYKQCQLVDIHQCCSCSDYYNWNPERQNTVAVAAARLKPQQATLPQRIYLSTLYPCQLLSNMQEGSIFPNGHTWAVAIIPCVIPSSSHRKSRTIRDKQDAHVPLVIAHSTLLMSLNKWKKSQADCYFPSQPYQTENKIIPFH